MKILVTGSHGFIGSHLVEKLLEQGNLVIGLDDFSTGKKTNLPEHRNLITIKADILTDISSFFEGVDVVFHLAAFTRPQESIEDPFKTTNINVLGTLNVLESCRKYGVRRLVFFSSSSIYGNQKVLPTKETAEPHPMSPYALTKITGEQYCELFYEMYGTESNYIRPFNVYGKRQNPHGGYAAAVPRFIETLSHEGVPSITGDGKQTRDFIYVGDVVELAIRAATSKVFGQAFNAGSGENISINQLYLMIAQLMKKTTVAKHVAEVFEPKITLADISKAKKLLDWEPKTKLEEGLLRTI